jgi:pimeloyl-ACP methyl ester carboxylesterase
MIDVMSVALAAAVAWHADGDSHFFDAKGVRIHYVERGRGEPVVLIHGLHASARRNWGVPGVIDELAKDHRVIALDLPGHGQSDKPKDERAYGVQLVEDVVLLLDELKLERAQVVGYSLGGMVAAKLAVTRPDRVSAVLLGGMGWLREGGLLQAWWEQSPAAESDGTPAEFVHRMGDLAVTADQLKKVAVPVEMVVGDRDPVRRWLVEPLRRLRPDWPVVVIGDAGHLECVVRRPFLDEVARWVRVNTKVVQATPPPRRI